MSGRPIIRAFFDEPTNTVSYLVTDPATNKAAVIDPVLDYDHNAGEVDTRSAEAVLAAAAQAHNAANRTAERIEIDERLSWFLVLSHRIDEGSAHADRTRDEAEAAGLSNLVIRIDAVRSLVRALTGDMQGAVELAEDVQARAQQTDDPYAKAKALLVLGGTRRK